MATPCETEVIRDEKEFTLNFTVTEPDLETPVDLTDSTVKYQVALLGASVLKIDGACAITDAANGLCAYEFVAGDLDTVGLYDALLEITYTSGRVRKIIVNRLRVKPDLPI